MSNRNFDNRVIIQRLQNKVYARNLYQNNTAGQPLLNPQTTDATSSRFNTYRSGSQTEYSRGLIGSGVTISPGGTPSPVSDPVTVPVSEPVSLFLAPSTNVGVSIVPQSPFIGGGNSFSFNGTSTYLSVVDNDGWNFGTGDFTIEWFQYQTDSNSYPHIFAIGVTPTTTSLACSIETVGGVAFYVWTGPGSPLATLFGNVTPYKNSWVHFAIVRNSGVLQVYKNGVQLGVNQPNTKNIMNSLPLYFGVEGGNIAQTWYGGLLTNIRFVKGLAVYTGTFTVPTTALTVTATANPYGGSNTQAIPADYTRLLFVP